MTISQFPGESNLDALVQHFGLDIEEEDDFVEFVYLSGFEITDDLETLEFLYQQWVNHYSKIV